MEARIPTRLTASEGRRFALTLFGAFLVLTALLWWRHRPIGVQVAFGAISGAMLVAALVAPTRLGPLQRAWMGIAGIMSKVMTPIVMAVLFFGVFTPLGLISRLFGKSSLVRSRSQDSFWVVRDPSSRRSQLQRQF